MRLRDVKPPNPADMRIARIWIAIESANTHHLIVSDSEKQGLARRAEPVRAGSPFYTQTFHKFATFLRTLCA
jgi:hypothetical protein